MRKSRANKGQFFVIAALLVSVVLVGGVISTYSLVRHPTIQESSPEVLSAIGEMNAGIKTILDFTVGYYGSILSVTGNSTYAQALTTNYLSSGLVNLARTHPEWNPSFTLESKAVKTRWFMPESSSMGELSVSYSLDALGISGITYETSSALNIEMLPSDSGVATIKVIRDGSEPELGLTKENFRFYNYTDNSNWDLVNPESITISSNGIYTMPLPDGIHPYSYSVQIEDNRGLVVSAFYSPDSVASESGIPHYTYTFDWESTGRIDIYNSLSTDNFVIELLQNGTLKWLSKPLEINPEVRPIPPIAVKAFRVNATISGVNQEVPFQVEDWGSDYLVPLGLSGNDSIFNKNNMLVFMINNEISEITLWWDGSDTAIQTPYAWENVYFNDNPSAGTLENGHLHLDVHNFYINSRVIGEFANYRTDFLRINEEMPDYGAEPAYVIYNGIVRDIIQQEPEYGGGGVSGCPNFYSQLYITLPAQTTYYTYAARTIFVESSQSRSIDDLSVIQLSVSSGSPLTEDGTSAGLPSTNSSELVFYDGYPTGWDHHWSQINSGNDGAGFMFTDSDNEDLYVFDDAFKRGAIKVESNTIEINPVDLSRPSVSFNSAKDLVWYGVVVSFNNEPIYRNSDDVGLWIMVENPPTVLMDEVEPGLNFVDLLSNVDASYDKGTHSEFNAQKSGPNAVYDTLTEALTGENTHDYVDNNNSDVDSSADEGSHSAFSAQQSGPNSVFDTLTEYTSSGSTNLINAESFEDSWTPSGWTATGRWNKESDYHYGGGYYSADFDGGSNKDGDLTTPDMDCSGVSSIVVDFWYRDGGCENGEFVLQYFDGTNWDTITDLHSPDWWSWEHYHHEITDSQYFVSNFKVRWSMDTSHNSDDSNVDMVTVTINSAQNNKLDLEAQWTSVPYSLPNEILAIYGGTMGAEDIAVDIWTGSSWQNVFSDLSSGWNNVSVSSWLTDSIFTIRYRGGNEVGDSTQDSWEIDAAILHVWDNDISYEIDLEVQWANVDYDETNEELCIYVGEVGSEELRVDVWTGSEWDNLFTGLNVGWNNATVSSYLSSSTFTIRFVGTTETGDNIQDYWTIDATLLHTWS